MKSSLIHCLHMNLSNIGFSFKKNRVNENHSDIPEIFNFIIPHTIPNNALEINLNILVHLIQYYFIIYLCCCRTLDHNSHPVPWLIYISHKLLPPQASCTTPRNLQCSWGLEHTTLTESSHSVLRCSLSQIIVTNIVTFHCLFNPKRKIISTKLT